MLRNQQISEQLLKHLLHLAQQQRLICQQNAVLCSKNSNTFRQGKIMGKLFGYRVSGSKKHWIPSTSPTFSANTNILFKTSKSGKAPGGGGKNLTRRMAVLNKLFMEHITDLLATGEISEFILGKGLQVSRVKISQDFAYVNVFWLSSGDVGKDVTFEDELQRCAGLLRHELSQLGLMGVVPRIKFVKEKLYTNMYQVEALLRNMDFGPNEDEQQQEEIDFQNKHIKAEAAKQEFYGSKINNIISTQQVQNENNPTLKTSVVNVPEMRHDVLGLDHKGIMLKIITKMRKSKLAWEQHLQNTTHELNNPNSTGNSSATSSNHLVKINEKLANAAANSDKFEAFLAKRKEKRNTPERKKFRISDHIIDKDIIQDQNDYTELAIPAQLRQIYDAEDYLHDDIEDKNLK